MALAAGQILTAAMLRQRLGGITPTGNITLTGSDVMYDSVSVTCVAGDKLELAYRSGFSLNATGRLVLRPRATSGGTVLVSSPLIQGDCNVPGDGGNCQFDITYEWTATATGLCTLGVSAFAAAGASSGSIYGTTDGRGRFLRIKKVLD